MKTTRQEIECLDRLNSFTGSLEDIMAFLHQENLMMMDEIKSIKASSDVPKWLQLKLANLSRDNKLQLLTYEWTILPVERIKVLIVTDRVTKEFSYNF